MPVSQPVKLGCCAAAMTVAGFFGCIAAAPVVASPLARCGRSDIDGDHITAANRFQVQGISCAYAFVVATGLTDSTAREKVKDSEVQTFATSQHGRHFVRRCRERTLEPPHVEKRGESGTNPEEPGADYRCSGQAELDNHPTGSVSLSFRWWLIGVRYCRRLALAQGFAATEIQVSRDVTCDAAARWIVTATTDILLFGHPYQREGEAVRYHYRDSTKPGGCGAG
jgi:hypothetical protein